MAANRVDLQPMVDALLTHASRTAAFDVIMSHEPRSAPSGKWTFACWVQNIDPIARASGLAVVSLRLEFLVRLYCPYVGPSADDLNTMDSDMAMRVGLLWNAYMGDFEFTAEDHALDVFGAHGDPMRMRGGFATFQNTPFRIADLLVPVIMWDVYDLNATKGSD
ncbi:MAG: hypothetical protein V4515_14415 [Chloroflexota bacterium]